MQAYCINNFQQCKMHKVVKSLPYIQVFFYAFYIDVWVYGSSVAYIHTGKKIFNKERIICTILQLTFSIYSYILLYLSIGFI